MNRRNAPPPCTLSFKVMKERLSRLDRIYSDASVFFVTFGTRNREKILTNELIHAAFIDFCERGIERQILVGRYVIMPDHIHLFVHLPDPAQLSSWMKSLKNALSKTLNSLAPAPHWQKGYFDHVLRSESSYEEKWQYIRMNAVWHKLAKSPEAWPYQGEITPLPFH
jgi:putative transposase